MSVPISSAINSSVPGETNLQKERNRFNELFGRLVNAVINQILDLRPQRAAQRMQYLVFLFVLSMLLITLTHRDFSLRLWADHLQSLFLYIFNPTYAASYQGSAINDFLYFVFQAFTDPHTLQYIPILLAPFFIAIQYAAIYLTDIFELQAVGDGIGVDIAREFIWEVALTGSNKTIRIQQGDISEEHRLSPTFLIGGPGRVIVDLDSAALFEKPNGVPHVIGPTGKEPGGKASLDGFERFRQAIDIRDQYVDLRDQDPKSQSVKGRSLDGLPITATDVRLMFSVYRGENPRKTDQHPYPFNEKSIEQIVYKASSEVTPGQKNPSAFKFLWINNMIGSIRGQLGKFIGERKLSEFLASIGMPEFEKSQQNEQIIADQVRQLTQQTDESAQAKEVKPPPKFTPRSQIKEDLFSEFAEDFTKNTHDKGVELHWIGVGTWKTPPGIEVVPKDHLEAWKLTQENLKNGSEEAMKKAENKAILEKLENLIRSVPLDVYDNVSGAEKQSAMYSKRDSKKKDSGKTTGSLSLDSADDMWSSLLLSSLSNRGSSSYAEIDHKDALKLMVLEYRKQLVEAVEFMKARNEAVPQKIEEAIKHLDEQLGLQHWVGK